MTLKHKNKPEFKYGKKISEKNNLKSVYPELAAMWDYEKNILLPENVHPRANKLYSWKCEFGHEWEQKLSNLCRGPKTCPVCSGKKPSIQKNLKTEFPEIYKEWDFKKNKNIDPLTVALGSNKKYWWVCKLGHSWQTTMHRRTSRGDGCKKCSYANRPKLLFKDEHPEFFKEININKNKNLDLENLRVVETNEKIWWTCSICNYDFQTSPKNRRKWHKVGVCSHEVLIKRKEYNPSKSIKNKAPELVKYFDIEKNYPLKPDLVSYSAKKKYWWICDNGHSYQQSPSNKSTILHRDKKINCPECKGRLLTDQTKLSIKNKRVSSEWDYSKNKTTPDKIHWKDRNNYWWKCKFGHSWTTSVYHRTRSKSDCPSCRLPSSLPEIRIYCELISLIKNVRHRFKTKEKIECDVYLEDYRLGIEYDGFYFHKDRLSKDIQKNKVLKKLGYKILRVRENGLKPTGCNEIFITKNGLRKQDLNKILQFVESNGIKIPKLNEYLKLHDFINEKQYKKIQYFLPAPPYNESFVKHYPEIADEFDLEKNKPLTPDLFYPNSAKRVWWLCKKNNHSWEALISNRTSRKSGCPKCSLLYRKENMKETEKSIYYKYPETREEYNADKNELNIKTLRPRSRTKVWWICKNCKSNHYKSISSWVYYNRKCKCNDTK